MIIQVAALLMVMFGGLLAGGILVVAVERVNLWRRMPVDQYVVDFRRSLHRMDPLMPIMGGLATLGAVVFALNTGGRSAAFAWTGAAIIAMIIIASTSIAEPINSSFRRLAEGEAPERADQLRITWRRFHFARTLMALAALTCIAAAVCP
jgi:hypothetical protein